MQLSSQMFDRIVGNAGEAGRSATVLPAGCRKAAERRQATRLAFGQRSQICRDRGTNAGVWQTVMVKDISVLGIGFLCDDALTIGDTFMLKLTDKESHAIRIRCKIERCERGGFGNTSYLLGAIFQQVIQQAAIRVNDDEGETPRWQESQSTGQLVHAAAEAPTMKPARVGPITRVVKAASLWMRKADDFS
jgi:PilZ domain